MTIELDIPVKKTDDEKDVPPTCDELLGRVIDLPHRSGSIRVEAPASSLVPYIPRRNTEETEEKEEEEKD